MNTTQNIFYRNGQEIKSVNGYEANTGKTTDVTEWNVVFTYPSIHENIFTNLNYEILKNINYYQRLQNSKELKFVSCGYTESVFESLRNNMVILENKYKIPHFEDTLVRILYFIVNNHKYIPTCRLCDFFRDEEMREIEPYGNIGYFIDLTDESVVRFFSNHNQQIHNQSIKIKNVVEMLHEIKKIVGTSEKYPYFKRFISRVNHMTNIEEIKNDEYYNYLLLRIDGHSFDYEKVIINDSEDKYENIPSGAGVLKHGTYENENVVQKKAQTENIVNHQENKRKRRFLEREIMYGKMLYDQPNIVKVYGKGVKDEESVLVMKEEERDLFEYIENELNSIEPNTQSLIEMKLKDTVIKICDILTITITFATNGFLFRDYKPENFLVTKEGRCIVCDLGSPIYIALVGQNINTTYDDESLYKRSVTKRDNNQFDDFYAIGVILSQFFVKKYMDQKLILEYKNPNGNDSNEMEIKVFNYVKDQMSSIIDFDLNGYTINQINPIANKWSTHTKKYIPQLVDFILCMIDPIKPKSRTLFDISYIYEETINYLHKEFKYQYKPIFNEFEKQTDITSPLPIQWDDNYNKPSILINEIKKWYEENYIDEIPIVYYHELNQWLERISDIELFGQTSSNDSETLDVSFTCRIDIFNCTIKMLLSLAFVFNENGKMNELKKVKKFFDKLMSLNYISSSRMKQQMRGLAICFQSIFDNNS